MDNQIQTFLDFLLDTETTSEVAFSQAIIKQDALYQARYRSIYEKLVDGKLQEWKEFNQKHQNVTTDRGSESEASESDSEQDSSSGNENEKPAEVKQPKKDQVS